MNTYVYKILYIINLNLHNIIYISREKMVFLSQLSFLYTSRAQFDNLLLRMVSIIDSIALEIG